MNRTRTTAVVFVLWLAASADLSAVAPTAPFGPASPPALRSAPASARLEFNAPFQRLMDELLRRVAPWRRSWPQPRGRAHLA